MLIAALTMMWGCSTADEDSILDKGGLFSTEEKFSVLADVERPSWEVDLMGTDDAPEWKQLNLSMYESKMYITVKLQDELVAGSTDDDEMAVFISGERRTQPVMRNVDGDGNVYFVLTIRGSNVDRGVTFALCYYSSGLHRMFTLEGEQTFAPELSYGVSEDFEPPLLLGCDKYPIQSSVAVTLPANTPFVPDDNDMIAVFKGDECRGVGCLGNVFTVFRTSADEDLQFRYYSVDKRSVYTLFQKIGNEENLLLSFY